MAGAFRTQFSVSFRGEPGSKSLRHRLPLTLVYKGAFDPNQDVWFSHYNVSEQEALHLQVSGHIVKTLVSVRTLGFGASGLRVCRFWSLGSGVWGLVVLALGFKLWALAVERWTPTKKPPQAFKHLAVWALRTRAVIEVLLSRCPKMRNRQSFSQAATNP